MINNPHPLTPQPQKSAVKPINPRHVPPSGQRICLGFYQFRLPDGEHIGVVRTSPDPDEVKQQLERALITQNPEVEFDFDHDFMYVENPEDIDTLTNEWRSKQNALRLTADKMGMDTPQRILTNPEVVEGSKAQFDAMKADGLLDEDATYTPPGKIERTLLTSVKPIGKLAEAPVVKSAAAKPDIPAATKEIIPPEAK